MFADHYPIIVILEGLCTSKRVVKAETKWNLFKPGGWEAYKEVSDSFADDINRIVDDERVTVDEMIGKIDKIQEKVKFKAFGKTTFKRKGKTRRDITADREISDNDDPKELLAKQSKKIEDEIRSIKDDVNGRVGRVFRMRDMIKGSKKSGQEAHAIRDNKTKEVIVNHELIKERTLEYNVNNLKNNEPSENVVGLVKVMSDLHDYRMSESEDTLEITTLDFDTVVKQFQLKNKRGYDFLVKAGEGFKKSVYKLCKRMIEQEKFPVIFEKTILQQIYKGKGSKIELENSRFIHDKDWLPKTCDALIVNKMKPDILAASSIFQIGGQPGQRTQEHLFTMRSVVALMLYHGEGIIAQLVDISRFFDKENIRDVMNTLHRIGVNKKAYRTWFLLNQKTRISVKTGVGMTEECDVGEVVGQGTMGGALVSQLNVDRGVGDYFEGSKDEATYGSIRLQPLSFQDDILRIATDVMSARVGNIKLSSLMEDKQLECHPDKTGFVMMGSRKFKEDIRRQVEKDPIMS